VSPDRVHRQAEARRHLPRALSVDDPCEHLPLTAAQPVDNSADGIAEDIRYTIRVNTPGRDTMADEHDTSPPQERPTVLIGPPPSEEDVPPPAANLVVVVGGADTVFVDFYFMNPDLLT